MQRIQNLQRWKETQGMQKIPRRQKVRKLQIEKNKRNAIYAKVAKN